MTGKQESPSDFDWLPLTRQIRDGHPDSLAVFYNHYFDLVYQEILRTSGRDDATSPDLAQETFLNIIRRIKPMTSQDHVTAWVRTVARTTTYDWLRRETRDLRRLQQRWEQNPQSQTSDNSTVNNSNLLDDSQARMLLLQEQLEAMPAELQEMISLRYRLGWSLARIGQRFGLKTGAVDGRIRRAMNKIRLQIDEGNRA